MPSETQQVFIDSIVMKAVSPVPLNLSAMYCRDLISSLDTVFRVISFLLYHKQISRLALGQEASWTQTLTTCILNSGAKSQLLGLDLTIIPICILSRLLFSLTG